MLWIATAAALSASAPATDIPAVSAQPQARATVRIMRPATIRLGEGAAGGEQEPAVRRTSVRDDAGQPRDAVLIEFS